MNQEFSNVSEAPKKNNTVLIIVVVLVAFLCCCCLLVVGAFALAGPIIGNTFESIEQGIYQEFPLEEMPFLEDGEWDSGDGDWNFGDYGTADYIPSGGLGDDTLRFDTWINVSLAAAFANCVVPGDGAARTEITIVQGPDNDGVWVERWTVPCDGGSPKSFTITFTPVASGGTDFEIKSD